MIEMERLGYEADIGRTAIQNNIALLSQHNTDKKPVFYVIFTPPNVIYAHDFEKAMRYGYPHTTFVPCNTLPDSYAWDMIMYSSDTGLPIARKQNRPS